MIVDCHTHWGIEWKERYGSDPAEWLKTLDKYGIGGAFLMPSEGLIRQEKIHEDNQAVCAVCSRAPERLIPLITASPYSGKKGLQEIKHCAQVLGARGLKFHPWLQGFSVTHPIFQDICTLAGELGLPVFFHDGTPPFSLPEQIIALSLKFPTTRFVLGHAGLLWNWRTVLLASGISNLFITLCGPHYKALEHIVRRVDDSQILWGSDFGFGLVDSVGYRYRLFKKLSLPEELERKILEENPARLMEEL